MTSGNRQSLKTVDQQQLVYMTEEQLRMYSAVHTVPLDAHNIPLDHQMIYASSAGNFQSPQNHRYYANPSQVLKGQTINQYTTTGAPVQNQNHYQQQVPSTERRVLQN